MMPKWICLFLAALFWSPESFAAAENNRIAKRQITTGSVPAFSQSSYTFPLSSCNAGTNVGTITGTNLGFVTTGGQTGYTVDPASVNGYIVTIGYLNGQMTLTSNASPGYSYTFNIRASNSFGTASVPVTVTCSASTSSNGLSNVVCPTTGSCYNTGLTTGFTSAVNTVYNPYSTVYNPYTTGIYGTQTAQTLYATNCFQGSIIGTVTYPGATGYLITGSQFTINANSGQITLLTPLTGGTYSATVQAYTTSGTFVSIPVTITASCIGGIGTTGYGTFAQSSYYFTATSCFPGGSVGSVYAPGALGYTIANGNNQFIISQAGLITLANTLSTGTYTLQVSSYGSTGTSATVPVTITVSCNGIGTTTFSQSSYFFTATSCFPGSTIGQVFASGATGYLINSGTGQFTVSPTGLITLATTLTAGTYSLSVSSFGTTGVSASVPVTITVSCSGTTGGVTFAQTSYALASASCTAGSSVGSVFGTNAQSYQIIGGTTGQFLISTAGQITLGTTVAAGTYSFSVQGFGSLGTATVPVTVTVTCGGTTGTGVLPTWNQQFYAFTVGCGTTGTSTYVGTVSAANAVSYSINLGSGQFTIDNSGNINSVSASTLSSAISSLTVVATGSSGAQIAIPVTVSSSCFG